MIQEILARLLLSAFLFQVAPTEASVLESDVRNIDVPAELTYGESSPPANLLYERSLRSPEEDLPYRINFEKVGIATSAESSMVVDAETGLMLYAERPYDIRPIGSVTKLMAAMVFLDQAPDLNAIVSIPREDIIYGGRFYVGINEYIRLEEILKASLIGSDNTATQSLIRFSGLTEEEFIAEMNEKASELGMQKTFFTDPTGIEATNVSTAADLVLLYTEAKNYLFIQEYTNTGVITIMHESGREVEVQNTNALTRDDSFTYDILAGKTGYLPEAGYVLGAAVTNGNDNIIAVVMGSDSTLSRAAELKDLVEWTYDVYEWPQ